MIVIDTNILVAALWSKTGASNRILAMALRREIECAVSVALALEYEDVLKRTKMREASWATMHELDDLLDALLSVATLAAPITTNIRPKLKDADDDMVLECALQSRAQAIVTMNVRDFAIVKKQFGIDVMQPGAFLASVIGARL
jgi:putative PIN family toxin of toxin-antitoxin system